MGDIRGIVACKACADYDRVRVQQSVDEIFALCGGMTIKPGQRVLVKVNLLKKTTPDTATTTHPEVARAVVCAVQRAGGVPVLADSPGGPFMRGALSGVYQASGMRAVAEETGCALNDDFSTTTRYFPEGQRAKQLDLIGLVDKVDAVITVGKLKTHELTTMTGCVKNLFGLVPGTLKVEYHSRYPKADAFSDMLVDLCACVKPTFAVMDAIDCMEGDGPAGGRPRRIGALLGGRDPHQVDALAAQLIGLEPGDVTTLFAAMQRGLLQPFDVVGDDFKALAVSDFDIPMCGRLTGLAGMVEKLPQAFRPRPVFTHKLCDGCGTCVRACPMQAISMDSANRPQVDLEKCIRCYCCQELCPKNDVRIRRMPLVGLIK